MDDTNHKTSQPSTKNRTTPVFLKVGQRTSSVLVAGSGDIVRKALNIHFGIRIFERAIWVLVVFLFRVPPEHLGFIFV